MTAKISPRATCHPRMTAVAPGRVGIRQLLLHELTDARKYWTSVVLAGLLTPLLYVLALGIGLGTVVNAHGNSLGVRYVVFVAPAFLQQSRQF